jgi:hypothetical protein
MKSLTILFVLFALPSLAYADMGIDCTRTKGRGVSLSDSSEGYYSIHDRGNPLIGLVDDLEPSYETKDTLQFRLDDGTSNRLIYSFENMRRCRENDTSEEVILSIYRDNIVAGQEYLTALTCSCAID